MRKGVSAATFEGKKHQPKFKGGTLFINRIDELDNEPILVVRWVRCEPDFCIGSFDGP